MPEDSEKRESISTAATVAYAVLGYLLPLIVILMDEMVFRTYYVSHWLPEWCEQAFRVVYFPVVCFLEQ